MNEPDCCQKCGCEYVLRENNDPSKYCDPCAQAALIEVEKERDALKVIERRLAEEMGMWWGVAIRRGDEIADLRRQLDSALSMNEMLKDQLRAMR